MTERTMKAPFCILLLSALSCAVIARAQTTEELWKVVTDKLNATTTNDNFFLFIGNESGVVFTFQKGTTIDGSTLVPIASATKWPMSTVIQRLLEEGILDLSTRPQDIISWWTNDPSDPRSRITVYHLLTFQSGFSDDAGCLDNQDSISLEDCVKVIYNMNVSHEPGSAFYYGGNHMQVLGFMAENKTGIAWKTLFSTYLTTPLGMTARYTGTMNPRMAGGIVSSAYDYGKMVRALYLKQLLQPETVVNMEVDRTNVTIAYSPAPSYGFEWHYAFGHWVECNSDTFLPECATDEFHVRSSAGAFGFYPFLDRTNNYYGVLSTLGSAGGVSAKIVYGVKDDINAAIKSASGQPSSLPSTSPAGVNTPTSNPSSNSPPNQRTPSRTSGSSVYTTIHVVLLVLLTLLTL